VIKARIAPGRGVMALLTGCREVGLYVIRIRSAFVIRLVTTHAGGIRAGEIVVVVDVTLAALQGVVRSRQWESGVVVVERCARPRNRVVALIAACRKVQLSVIRIRGAVVVRHMATRTCRIRTRKSVIVIGVALRAKDLRVSSGQCPAGGRMIEGCSRPGCRVVTLLASRREPNLRVRRAIGVVEVVLMATDASRARIGEVVIIVCVALRTLQVCMRAGQGKTGAGVIEGRVQPACGGMTLLAGCRKPSLDVIRIRRPVEILYVAGSAVGWCSHKLAIHVTL